CMVTAYVFVFCVSDCLDSTSISFFFIDTATTDIYTLSLHDALPIFSKRRYLPKINIKEIRANNKRDMVPVSREASLKRLIVRPADRKSTRLNSSHVKISYAVFCLKKKKKIKK